jgi:predicted nucleic acid-binding protein
MTHLKPSGRLRVKNSNRLRPKNYAKPVLNVAAKKRRNMYADVDFWVALLKGDDWLTERAEELYAEHKDDLEVSLTTFIELFLIEEQFSFDRDQAAISILEMTNADVDEQVIFQASEYIDDGLNVFDAFHAALAGDVILSSDKEFDDIGIKRVQLEPETTTTETKAKAEDE